MKYLERFDAPELPLNASTLRCQLELSVALNNIQLPTPPSIARLITTFVITTDKAAREYSLGRLRINDYLFRDKGVQAFVEGMGHFETCVNSARRALRALKWLKASRSALPIPRDLRRRAQAFEKEFAGVRDLIEHIDERIIDGVGIPDGAPHLLTISMDGECFEIYKDKIKVANLQGLVSALHDVGEKLLHLLQTNR